MLFHHQLGTAERHIREGKNAIVGTRLSCRRFAANAVRLQRHGLAYDLANFLRTLTSPDPVSHRSMTSLRDRLVKIGAKIFRHGRSITCQMAEVMVSRGWCSSLSSTPTRRCLRCRRRDAERRSHCLRRLSAGELR